MAVPLDLWQLVLDTAAQWQLDPYVLGAIVEVESQWNPWAIGDGGCSYGLMQLNQCAGLGVGWTTEELQTDWINLWIGARNLAATPFPGDIGQWAADAQRPFNPEAYASEIHRAYDRLLQEFPPTVDRIPAGSPEALPRYLLAGFFAAATVAVALSA